MKKVLALALSAALLVGLLAGCGGKTSDRDRLVGKWSSTQDMTDFFNQGLAESDLGEELQVDKLEVVLVLELKDDDTYTLALDEDALAATAESIRPQLKEGMISFLNQTYPGVDVEDVLAQLGMTMDELLDETVPLESMASAYDMAGQYMVKDGVLYLSDGLDEAPEETDDDRNPYTLDGDQLTLRDVEGNLEDVVFQRVR